MPNNDWTIEIKDFQVGYSPLAFSDSLTEVGNGGHASTMQNVDVLNGKLTQGKGITNLTNGDENGNVSELIEFIMDRATADNESWAFGTTKLFKLSSTSVAVGTAVTNCVEGESLTLLKGNLYGFYNTASAGEILKMPLSTETIDPNWGSTTPTGFAAIEKAPHPSDKKEDIMLFGNGRYVGTYIANTDTLTPQKLDFGNDAEVGDVLYNSGFWYLAVNSGITGTNRTEGQVYLYDGAAQVSTLSDEAGVGMQRIGFLSRINGIVFVAYQDLTATGFIIGFIQGKSITPLVRYTGTLPTFQQKTLFNNTLMFLSSGLIYSAGAIIPEFPYQLSQYADGGYATLGAIAAPFGTPMVSSTDGATGFRLAQFSGFSTDSNWKSIVFDVSGGKHKGFIDEVIVFTKTLGANASADITIEADQASSTSDALTVTTAGKRRHYFGATSLGQIEDFRVAVDYSGGDTTNDCLIRKIVINGHSVEYTG